MNSSTQTPASSAAHEVLLLESIDPFPQAGDPIAYSAADQVADIFAGASGNPDATSPGICSADSPVQSQSPSQSPSNTNANENDNGTLARAQHEATDGNERGLGPLSEPSQAEVAAAPDTERVSSMAAQLTDSLDSANGPPANERPGESLAFAAAGLTPLTDLLDVINSKLEDYANAILGGEQTFAFGDLNLAGYFQLTAPTLTFRGIQFSGGTADRVFSGTVLLSTSLASLSGGSAFSISLKDGPDTDTVGLAGTYTLLNQPARDGTFSLLVDQLALTVAGFAEVNAASVTVKTTLTTGPGGSTTRDFQLGATGVNSFLGEGPLFQPDGSLNPAARGVRVSSGALGLLVRRIDGNDPNLALDVTGSVDLLGFAPDLGLAGTGWRVQANTIGNLSQAPVLIDLGGGAGQVTLAPAQTGYSFAGTATLTTPLASAAAGFVGTETFTYTLSDGTSSSPATATVSLSVSN